MPRIGGLGERASIRPMDRGDEADFAPILTTTKFRYIRSSCLSCKAGASFDLLATHGARSVLVKASIPTMQWPKTLSRMVSRAGFCLCLGPDVISLGCMSAEMAQTWAHSDHSTTSFHVFEKSARFGYYSIAIIALSPFGSEWESGRKNLPQKVHSIQNNRIIGN